MLPLSSQLFISTKQLFRKSELFWNALYIYCARYMFVACFYLGILEVVDGCPHGDDALHCQPHDCLGQCAGVRSSTTLYWAERADPQHMYIPINCFVLKCLASLKQTSSSIPDNYVHIRESLSHSLCPPSVSPAACCASSLFLYVQGVH